MDRSSPAKIPVQLCTPRSPRRGLVPLGGIGAIWSDSDGLVLEGDPKPFHRDRSRPYDLSWLAVTMGAGVGAVLSRDVSAWWFRVVFHAATLVMLLLHYASYRHRHQRTVRLRWSDVASAVSSGVAMRLTTARGEIAILPSGPESDAGLTALGHVITRNACASREMLPPLRSGHGRWWVAGGLWVAPFVGVAVNLKYASRRPIEGEREPATRGDE